jgi:chromosome partitioning protein
MTASQQASMTACWQSLKGQLPMTITLAVLNQKGGVGKTTLATNLAAASHLAGYRTLLLDLDPQSSALDWNQARADGSALDGLSVAKFDKPLVLSKFTPLVSKYDVTVLDGPARLGKLTLSAAVVADAVLVPMQPAYLDLWASDATLEVLAEADAVREQLGLMPVRRWFVLNQVKSGTRVSTLAKASIAELGNLVDVAIHHRTSFVLATGRGESVLTEAPKSAAATEISRLFDATLAVMLSSRQASKPAKGAVA